MRGAGCKFELSFQNGILMKNNSLKTKHNVRCLGHTNDHPASLDFMYRLGSDNLGEHSCAVFTLNQSSEMAEETGTETCPTAHIGNDKTFDIITPESLTYVAGYVAHHFRAKYSNLGNPTKTSIVRGNTWIEFISCGQLMLPRQDFVNAIIVAEKVFLDFRVTEEILKTCAEFPSEVIEYFVKTRTYIIRVKELNKEMGKQSSSAKPQFIKKLNE
ncbi:hypothetical protein PR048_025531 [Dryococelus australis]|uniref:BTB domain-containing protein n=1 Tax=Dryococelus australis TaxID=614101 RepID=A0ABQ9GRN6_9NEOP|nr:hypothetical protein PR048_025531 [Dryococelus australis]